MSSAAVAQTPSANKSATASIASVQMPSTTKSAITRSLSNTSAPSEKSMIKTQNDPVVHNFMTYLFLGLTLKSFYANVIFMAVRFSGLRKSGAETWLFYISILLFLFSSTVPIALAFEDKLRNQFPKNLLCIMAFTTLVSVAASLFNIGSADVGVWAVSYLSLFSFLFIFVIGSAGFADLSNPTHAYLLTSAILLVLTGIFLAFSFIVNIDVSLFTMALALILLTSITSYTIFETRKMLENNKINASSLSVQELTKTITYVYCQFVYRSLSLGMQMKEPN